MVGAPLSQLRFVLSLALLVLVLLGGTGRLVSATLGVTSQHGRGAGANQPGREAKAPRDTTHFAKTKICKFWLLQCCNRGADCAFAHGRDQMETAPDLYRTQICKTLLNFGQCKDPHCRHAHDRNELRRDPLTLVKPRGAGLYGGSRGGDGEAGSAEADWTTAQPSSLRPRAEGGFVGGREEQRR